MDESSPLMLSIDAICEQAGVCDVSDRDFKRNVQQLLCRINSSIVNTGGGGTGVGVLKSFVASDVGAGLDCSIADSDVSMDVSAQISSSVVIYGTFSGTVVFECSIGEDSGGDPHWQPLLGQDEDSNPIFEFTASGIYFFNVRIFDKIRMRVDIAGSGKADYIWAIANV